MNVEQEGIPCVPLRFVEPIDDQERTELTRKLALITAPVINVNLTNMGLNSSKIALTTMGLMHNVQYGQENRERGINIESAHLVEKAFDRIKSDGELTMATRQSGLIKQQTPLKIGSYKRKSKKR